MELLETQDPERKRLIESSERHKLELQKEVKAISDRTESILTNALIIGGALAITYVVVSQVVKSKSKSKKKDKEKGIDNGNEVVEQEPEAESLFSQIGNKVLSQATLILLDIAKEKLLEYLESRKLKNENS